MIGTVRHRPRLARLAPLALVGLALVGVGLVAAALAAADDEPHPALPSKLAPTTLLLDAARAGERLVAVGAWGHVILSDDGGESWRQARSVPVQAVLTSVFFVDERQGWAAGHDAVILHSTDGGETWSLQHRDIESDAPLFSVWMADSRSGLAVGAFGMALRTRDGGAHWEAAPLLEDGEDVHLNAIFQGPDGALFVAAEAGQLYRSVDGGERWEVLDVPYQGSLWGGLSTAEDSVLVFGMRGNVLRSDDAGGSFTAVDSGTDQSLGGGTVLADGQVVLAGLGGAVSVSRDGGRSFSTRIGKERRGANAVLEGAAGIWLFGEGGVRRMDRAPTPAPTER